MSQDKTKPGINHSASSLDIISQLQQSIEHPQYFPLKIPNAEIADVSNHSNQQVYMLRNPNLNKYLQIGEQELFFWKLFDGKNSIKDLNIEYINQYGELGDTILQQLLHLLKSNGFLQEPPQPVIQIISQKIHNKTAFEKFISLISWFFHSSLTTGHADRFFAWLYRQIGYLLFLKPLIFLFGFLVIFDTIVFIDYFFLRHISLLLSKTGVGMHDLALLLTITYLSLFLHECAHGLAVKHYDRIVLRAGILLYFGQPIAYVDTTDIWMKNKFPRIVVSFAGPALNGILGGIFFLISFFTPDSTPDSILVQAGLINSIFFLVNLLPIVETDGHYIIQDYLEINRLRPESLAFIGYKMWKKLYKREKWGKVDFIYLIYGIIAIAGMVVMISVGIHLWYSTVYRIVIALYHHPEFIINILGLLVLIGIIVLLVHFFLRWKKGLGSIEKKIVSSLHRKEK